MGKWFIEVFEKILFAIIGLSLFSLIIFAVLALSFEEMSAFFIIMAFAMSGVNTLILGCMAYLAIGMYRQVEKLTCLFLEKQEN